MLRRLALFFRYGQDHNKDKQVHGAGKRPFLEVNVKIAIKQHALKCNCNCNCNGNWGTCTRRPRAHHRVNPYLGACEQNETRTCKHRPVMCHPSGQAKLFMETSYVSRLRAESSSSHDSKARSHVCSSNGNHVTSTGHRDTERSNRGFQTQRPS